MVSDSQVIKTDMNLFIFFKNKIEKEYFFLFFDERSSKTLDNDSHHNVIFFLALDKMHFICQNGLKSYLNSSFFIFYNQMC